MTNYVFTPEEAAYYGKKLFGAVGSGELKINIYKEYPFTAEGAKEAHTDLTGGKSIGKLLIKVNPDA